jgi:serine protease AprX
VQLRGDVSPAEGGAIVRAAGGQVTGRLPIINGVAARLSPRAQTRLADDGRIARVSVNARTFSTRMSSIRPPRELDSSRLETAYPFSVLAAQSWGTATGEGVGVAVIDTGIDGGHPDFADPNGDSRVVAAVVTNPDAETAADTYGHGTHVAGIIAGDGSRRDMVDPAWAKYIGIAPRANLIAIKAADDEGRGTILDAIYGLQFVVDHKDEFNIRVVNLSLSSTVAESYRTDPLNAAVESAYFNGILVVAAAGNRGSAEDATDYSPANDPFALTVGAVDDQGTEDRGDDAIADWSSTGLTQDGFLKPEIAAPGAHMVSTLARDSAFAEMCPSCIVDDEYIRIGGTSMAAPVVSGVAALLFEQHPAWTPEQVKSTLVETARDVTGRADEVNAAAALGVERPATGYNTGIAPNQLVDATTGEIDYTRSSWGRSSWGRSSWGGAEWARSSWGCTCGSSLDGGLETTRSSWGAAAWLARWDF